MDEFLTKIDKVAWGLAIGIGVPVGLFFLVKGLIALSYGRPVSGIDEDLSLFCIAVNLILVRQIMIKAEKDQVGKGIIASTLVLVLVWVALFHL